jgi:hypothetical protein
MLLEDLLFLLLIIALFYEVLLPILMGRPIFPMFRKSTWTEMAANRAAYRLQQAKIALEAAQMEAEAKAVEEAAKKLDKPKRTEDAR